MTHENEPEPAPDEGDETLEIRREIDEFLGSSLGESSSSVDRGRFIDKLSRRAASWLEAPPELPELVGEYHIGDFLGQGGMGTVYRAVNRTTRRRVALKVAPVGRAGDAAALVREAEKLARVNHDNVIKVVDSGEDSGFRWVATDLVEGETLRDMLRSVPGYVHDVEGQRAKREQSAPRVRPDVRRVAEIFRDLARGLFAMHEADLLHLDIKPANVMVGDGGRAYLIDFGLVREMDEPLARMLGGTVPYMSPEQVTMGAIPIGERSDIYSLGLTLFESLTGRRIIRDGDRVPMLEEIQFGRVPRLSEIRPDLPAQLDAILLMALEKRQGKRYETAEELATDLDCFLHGRDLRFAVVKTAQRVREVVRHSRRRAIIALIIVAAGVSAWLAFREPPPPPPKPLPSTMKQAQAFLDEREFLEALTLVRTERDLYMEDERAIYQAALEGAIPELTNRVLAVTGTSVTALFRRTEARRLTLEAEKDLEFSPSDRLLLQAALGRYMAGEAREGLALLDGRPSLVKNAPFLQELRLICMLTPETMDRARYQQLSLALGDRHDRSHTVAYGCLHALRVTVEEVEHAKGEILVARKRDDSRLEAVHAALSDVVAAHPRGHLMARSLKGLIRLTQRRHKEALRNFQLTLSASGSDAERAGLIYWAAVAAWIVSKSDPTVTESARLWTTRIAGVHLALRDRLTHELEVHVQDTEVREAGIGFLETLLNCNRLEPLSVEVLSMARRCIDLSNKAHDAADMVRVGNLIAPRLAPEGALVGPGLFVLRYWLWGHAHRARTATDAVVESAEVACRAFALARDRFGKLEDREKKNSCAAAERYAIAKIRKKVEGKDVSSLLLSWLKEKENR